MAIIGIGHLQAAAPAGSEDVARGFCGGPLGLEHIAKPTAL